MNISGFVLTQQVKVVVDKNGNAKVKVFLTNLYVHTVKSDGSMTLEEYLEHSRKYSDKVAKQNNFFETGRTDTHGQNIFRQSAQSILDILF